MKTVMLCPILLALVTQGPAAPPSPPREFRAAWIATVDNIDWPSKKGLTAAQAKEELRLIIDRAEFYKLNALIFQVRPMADALYVSAHEPWSEFLTGQQGKAPNEPWDPLAYAVEECHRRGIELHAWFNPYRAWHFAATGPAHATHISRKRPDLVRSYSRFKWMDPGDPRVQDISLKVMLDVVRRYNIDGVHIDDYFYPYPAGKTPFPDHATYAKYGKGLSRADWRRRNVDLFVKRLYEGIKKEKRWVKFGISPFGIYRPNMPQGIEAGIDQYADLYADAKKWLNQGWCDYFTPQLYWGVDSKGQGYGKLLRWWVGQNSQGRHIWPGNAAYKMVEGPKWGPEEMVDQIDLTRRIKGATGNVFFSAKYITQNTKSLGTELSLGPYAQDALVPASPWLGRQSLPAPKLTQRDDLGDTIRFTWAFDAPRPVCAWALWTRYGADWTFHRVSTAEGTVVLNKAFGEKPLQDAYVAGVDRFGGIGPWLKLL